MKLQACHKCSAQFDVSGFSAGQQFTCGSCATVLVAHQAAGPARTPGGGRKPGAPTTGGRPPAPGRRPATPRKPAAPRKPAGRAPATGGRRTAVTGGPGGASKGPQYQRVKRDASPEQAVSKSGRAASGRAASGRPSGARPAAGRGAPGRSAGAKKPNMLPIVAGVALIVIVGVVVMMGGMGGGSDGGDTGGSKTAGTEANQPVQPAAPADTLALIRKDFFDEEPTTEKEYRLLVKRVKGLASAGGPEGAGFLKKLYKAGVDSGALYNDDDARAALGFKKFFCKIPEGIFIGHAFIQDVIEFNNKTWYAADETAEYEQALVAQQVVETHLANLESDHSYRAGDNIVANVKNMEYLRDYNFATYWAKPYLICYASNDYLPMTELMKLSKTERKDRKAELARKRKRWDLILKEKGLIMQQIYEKFLSVYQVQLKLGRFEDKWGGKPDYKQGFRSYEDGIPLIIWIFDNKEAWSKYHKDVVKVHIPESAAGYFSSRSGWVFLYDEKANPRARQFEINKNLHEGMHQLQYWYNVQLMKWNRQRIKFRQDWLGEGLAEYYGSASMDKKRQLTFHGVNVPRLDEARNMKAGLNKADKKYPIFPLQYMVQFNTYAQMKNWGSREWGINPGAVMGLFYQQSYGFVRFLHEFENAKYLEQFNKFFFEFLHRGAGEFEGARVFRAAFEIEEDEDWEAIQKEFDTYMRKLLKMDVSSWRKKLPKKDDWGDE